MMDGLVSGYSLFKAKIWPLGLVKSPRRKKSEVQILAECSATTTVNLETALRFFSRMCSLESLEMLESEHHSDGFERGVLAWSVADGPKAYQGMENRP